MTALSLVQDCLFVNGDGKAGGKCVSIGSRAWLGGNSIILGGSRIGNDSVVAAGALCADIEIPDYSLASGCPVQRGVPIENLLKFKRVV